MYKNSIAVLTRIVSVVSIVGNISCNSNNDIEHDAKSEYGSNFNRYDQSINDSIIVDDEFIFLLIDMVLQNAIIQTPDSLVYVNNLYMDGVVDTIIYVNNNGMKAEFYSTSYVEKHILWYADIDLESEIGLALWRRLIESHEWPKHINIQLMDFEAQHLVRVIQGDNGKSKMEYCLSR